MYYRVILLDNRGVGRSSDTNGPVSIAEMAVDAKAVLDAAGVESAHVIGKSMGGMIAEEFVLNHPESVRSLILSVTMCGGKESVPADMNVLLTLQSSGTMSATEAFWAMAPFIYDLSTPRSVLEDDLNQRLRHSLRPQNYLAQLQAIVTWQGTFSRLSQISVPTLVIHGLNDRLIVPKTDETWQRQFRTRHLSNSKMPATCSLPISLKFGSDCPVISRKPLVHFRHRTRFQRSLCSRSFSRSPRKNARHMIVHKTILKRNSNLDDTHDLHDMDDMHDLDDTFGGSARRAFRRHRLVPI